MASITLNPMLTSISGTMGRIVFYTRWKNVYARIYAKPRNPDTEKQRANRALFRDAMISWKVLSAEQKESYNLRARRLPMTGHNLFISEYMKKHFAQRVNAATETVSRSNMRVLPLQSAYTQRAIYSVIPPYILQNSLYSGNTEDKSLTG